MKPEKKIILAGCIIFILAFTLRVFRIGDLSYFSGDEEIIGFILRRMAVDKIPVLTSPSATLGLSLGAFFHWLALPFYMLFENKYQPLFYLAALLGALSAAALYFVVCSFWSRKAGFIAGIFYSCSFLIILFDMRFWVHSINPILTIFNLWGLNQMARGRYRYSILVAVSVIFGWHSDPAILALGLATLLTFIIFKLPLWKREYKVGYLIIAMSVLPLLFFDLRHNFINLTRLNQLIWRPLGTERMVDRNAISVFQTVGTGLGKIFYISSGQRADLNFCYCYATNYLNVENFMGLFLALIFIAIYLYFYSSTRKPTDFCRGVNGFSKEASGSCRRSFRFKSRNPADAILLIQLLSILGGLVVYNFILGGSVFQFYLTGVFPLIAIMAAVALDRFPNIISGLLLSFWLVINLIGYANGNSMGGMKYKNEIVKWIKNEVKDGQYALEAKGTGMIEGGGWTYLLAEAGVSPRISYIDPVMGWLYEDKVSVSEVRDTILLTNAETFINDLVFDKEFISGAFKVYLIRK